MGWDERAAMPQPCDLLPSVQHEPAAVGAQPYVLCLQGQDQTGLGFKSKSNKTLDSHIEGFAFSFHGKKMRTNTFGAFEQHIKGASERGDGSSIPFNSVTRALWLFTPRNGNPVLDHRQV